MCDQDSRFGSLVRFFQPQTGTQQVPMTGPGAIPGATVPQPTIAPSMFSKYVAPVLRGAAAGAMAAPGPTTGLAAPGFGKQLFTGLGAAEQANLNRQANGMAIQNNLLEQAQRRQAITSAQQQQNIDASKEARAQEEFNLEKGLRENLNSQLGITAPASTQPLVNADGSPNIGGETGGIAAAPASTLMQDSPLLKVFPDQKPEETDALRSSLMADAFSKTPGLAHYNATVQQLRTQRAITDRANNKVTDVKPTPEAIAAGGLPPDFRDTTKYPQGRKDPQYAKDVQNYVSKGVQLKQANTLQAATARGIGFAQGRALYSLAPPMLDTDNDNQLMTALTVNDVIKNPGRFVQAVQGEKIIKPSALLSATDQSITNAESKIPILEKMSEADKLAVNRALSQHGGALGAYLQSRAATDELSPQGKEYVAAIARLEENIPNLRNILGHGQSSDQRIGLLLNTISGFSTSLDPELARRNAIEAHKEIELARKTFPALPNQGGSKKPPKGANVISLQQFLNQK